MMGFRAGLALTAVGDALLVVALFLATFFLFLSHGAGVFVAIAFFYVAAPIWLTGLILVLLGFAASRGVRSRAIGSLLALASATHLVFAAALLVRAGGAPTGPAYESAALLVPPIAIAALLGLASARRF